jgi:hypothetical protein
MVLEAFDRWQAREAEWGKPFFRTGTIAGTRVDRRN